MVSFWTPFHVSMQIPSVRHGIYRLALAPIRGEFSVLFSRAGRGSILKFLDLAADSLEIVDPFRHFCVYLAKYFFFTFLNKQIPSCARLLECAVINFALNTILPAFFLRLLKYTGDRVVHVHLVHFIG